MNELEIILAKLFASYPNTAIGELTVASYIEQLSDIPACELAVVVRQCLRECKFLPTIAELVERHRSLTAPPQLAATDAWGQVKREIRRTGSWRTPTFDDPLIAQVVRNMGWLELCQSESPEGVDRAQFERAYNELAQRSVKEQKLLPAARELSERNGGKLTHIKDAISAYLPTRTSSEHN